MGGRIGNPAQREHLQYSKHRHRRAPFRTYSQFLTGMEDLLLAGGRAAHLAGKFKELNVHDLPDLAELTIASYQPSMLIPSESLQRAVRPHLDTSHGFQRDQDSPGEW